MKIAMLHTLWSTSMLSRLNGFIEDSINVSFMVAEDQSIINKIPFFIIQSISVKVAYLLGVEVIFFTDLDIVLDPSDIIKKSHLLKKVTNLDNIYYSEKDRSRYFVKEMIGSKTNFIIYDRIIYIPSFLFLFKENKKNVAEIYDIPSSHLSPASQFILINIIFNATKKELSSQDIIDLIGSVYSRMTVNRAVHEFLNFGLIDQLDEGRKRIIILPNKRVLFEKSLKFMTNPIIDEYFDASINQGAMITGDTAIEIYSKKTSNQLMPITNYIKKAVYRKIYFKENHEKKEYHPNPNIEIWSYPPKINFKTVDDHKLVDPISLYLIELSTRNDVRCLAVLEEVIGEYLD